jgi:hypothetical protein
VFWLISKNVYTFLHHKTFYVIIIPKYHYNYSQKLSVPVLHRTTNCAHKGERSTNRLYILPATDELRLAVEPKLPAGVLCPPKLANGDPVGQLLATGPRA